LRSNFFLTFGSVLIIAFLSAGCVTTDEPPEEVGKTPIIQKELPEIEEARKLILFGSPSSVMEGYELLRNAPAGNSIGGQELLYIAKNLMEILYPKVPFDPGVSIKPGGSSYIDIFKDVRGGEFSVLLEDWDSSLKLAIVSCAALFTEDTEVLTLCGAAAQAALGADPSEGGVVSLYILGTIEKKRGNFENAVYYYEQAYRQDSLVYPAKWESAEILRQLNDNSNALPLLQELVLEYPDNVDYSLELSACLFEMVQIESAIKAVSEITIQEDHQRYDEYLLLKSRLEEAAGEIDTAVITTEILHQRNPDDVSVLQHYGGLLLLQGKIGKGIAVLELAVEKGLTDLNIVKRIAAYYAELENWEEAKRITDTIYDQLEEPSDLALSAKIYRYSGEFDSARNLAELLVAKVPENSEYLTLYAEILLSQADYRTAAGIIQTSLNFASSRQHRSYLYLLLSSAVDSPEQRIEALQNALFENMENVDALLKIAKVYKNFGEYTKANRYIKQASALAPDNEKVAELARDLEGLLEQ